MFAAARAGAESLDPHAALRASLAASPSGGPSRPERPMSAMLPWNSSPQVRPCRLPCPRVSLAWPQRLSRPDLT